MRRWAIAVITMVAIVHCVAAGWAASTKGPTADEPLHLVGAWNVRHHGEFRVNREDPPLWQYYAALAVGGDDFQLRYTERDFADAQLGARSAERYYRAAMFGSTSPDPYGVLARARWMMAPFGGLVVWLGALLARRMALRIVPRFADHAAVAAALLLAANPTLLGHSGLLKNDVIATVAITGLIWATCRLMERHSMGRLGIVSLWAAVSVTVKFSGIPMVLVAMAVLLVSDGLRRRWLRGLTSAATVALTCWVAVWACYGFRYAPGPVGTGQISLENLRMFSADRQMRAAGTLPEVGLTRAAYAGWQPDAGTRVLAFIFENRIVPQAYVGGLMYTRASTRWRPSYVWGSYPETGALSYFPTAAVTKTPLSHLAALGIGAAGLGVAVRRRRSEGLQLRWREEAAVWAPVCFAGVYAALAILGSLNLGLRHLLPVFPVTAAVAAVGMCVFGSGIRKRATLCAVSIVAVLLVVVEPGIRFPHWIAYFNYPAECYGPERILGDSNLDWGQDVPLLAKWQREHADRPLYLLYFGADDPRRQGLRYINLPGSAAPPPGPAQDVTTWDALPANAVVAIGTTDLQGIYFENELRAKYDAFRQAEPFARLGGTIYLYDAAAVQRGQSR